MIGFELTETQRLTVNLAKKFADEEIKPITSEFDRIQDVTSPEAFPWEMVKKGSDALLWNTAM